MKFYPTADPDFYVDHPNNWELYCRHPADYVWKAPPIQLDDKIRTINYYRDLEGAKKPKITGKDIYIDCWPNSRLKPGACLPVFYALGARFIKLEQAPPLGFRCAQFPINLREVHKKEKDDKKAREKAAKEASFNKMIITECQKAKKKTAS